MTQLKRSIILALGVALIGFSPIAAQATQPMKPNATAPAKRSPNLATQLNLKPEQQNQLRSLKQERLDAIVKVLNDDGQKKAFQDSMKTSQSLNKALAAAKLAPDQQAKIVGIRQAYGKKMLGVLDASQQKQLAELRKQKRDTSSLLPT
jgi:Spy/CpxP family protein refolding chaperone